MATNYQKQVAQVHNTSTLVEVVDTLACAMTDRQLMHQYVEARRWVKALSEGKQDEQCKQFIRQHILIAEMCGDVLKRRGVPECTWWQASDDTVQEIADILFN
mgnify:CR=1 FL=1